MKRSLLLPLDQRRVRAEDAAGEDGFPEAGVALEAEHRVIGEDVGVASGGRP